VTSRPSAGQTGHSALPETPWEVSWQSFVAASRQVRRRGGVSPLPSRSIPAIPNWPICPQRGADVRVRRAANIRSARSSVPDCLPLSSLCVAYQVCGTADHLKQVEWPPAHARRCSVGLRSAPLPGRPHAEPCSNRGRATCGKRVREVHGAVASGSHRAHRGSGRAVAAPPAGRTRSSR